METTFDTDLRGLELLEPVLERLTSRDRVGGAGRQAPAIDHRKARGSRLHVGPDDEVAGDRRRAGERPGRARGMSGRPRCR